jgi:hypothetical protein
MTAFIVERSGEQILIENCTAAVECETSFGMETGIDLIFALHAIQ